MTDTPTTIEHDDILDSRDIIARIEHLRQLRQPGPVDLGPEDNDTDQDTLFAELTALEALAEEAGSISDWEDSVALIADSHFEDYAREMAEDIGAIKNDANWPCNFIDWPAAAEALKKDYTSVEYDGKTYWARS